MSTIDYSTLHLSNADKTEQAGESLAKTIYRTQLLVLLSGELGAGKTSFVKGFAKGLGVEQDVTSPTYALEQIYTGKTGIRLTHIDLYRLSKEQAKEFIKGREWPEGVTCIEWAHRLPEDWGKDQPHLFIEIEEEGEGRSLKCSFNDIPLPTDEQIWEWREEVMLPQNIRDHCDAVGNFSKELAETLQQKGHIVRIDAVRKAGMLHDLLRFVDFHEGGAPAGYTNSSEQERVWTRWKERYPGVRHEQACEKFLIERGYPELGNIVEPHGLVLPSPERTTIEQIILYYADKRTMGNTVVSLDDRFADFIVRYSGGEATQNSQYWYDEAKRIERELGL